MKLWISNVADKHRAIRGFGAHDKVTSSISYNWDGDHDPEGRIDLEVKHEGDNIHILLFVDTDEVAEHHIIKP